MLEIQIRPPRLSDALDMNEIRRQKDVRDTTLGLMTDTLAGTESFLSNLSTEDQVLVAEVDEDGKKKVVGIAGLHVNKSHRLRHSASFGISVNADYHGKGIGKRLMKELLYLADNDLMLIRVELGVLESNKRARRLYESFGFEYEGTKKYAIATKGRYEDECIMARYHIPIQFKE